MKNRTAKALAGTPYIVAPYAFKALVALVDYAAQNPGLEYGNYGDPVSYNAESRSIRKDWARVCEAVQEAARAGVGDKEVIEAAPQAFSGRLTWKVKFNPDSSTNPAFAGSWDYCTGQYWPTEYRKAVASVLERATHSLLQSKPIEPLPSREYSLAEMKAIAKTRGSYFFSNKREGERMTKISGNRIKVVQPGVYSNGGDHVSIFKFNPENGSFNVEH